MSVDLNRIFDQKVREFRHRNAPERLTLDFIDAANKTVKELSLHSHPQAEIADISAVDTIIDIDSNFYYVVGDGISYYLAKMGQTPQNGVTLQALKAEWDNALGSYIMDIVNTKQDDPTNDIIGLGAVGTNKTY